MVMHETTSTRQILLFDADDTLWENNIFFEQAIASFISFLDHQSHTPEQVREHLNRCEHATIVQQGYGLASFSRSLVTCFEQLTEAPLTDEAHAHIAAFAGIVAEAEMALLPHVRETLSELAGRYRLILVTKGSADEQLSKLERSGLKSFFSAAEVLAEKDAAAYQRVLVEHDCETSITWMIGNSPRSDINPALAVGLNAVYIPHASTWVLEHETLCEPLDGRRLLRLTSFQELVEHF